MKAGPRDRKIVIERATVTQDAFGGEVKTWVTYAEAWAQVLFNKGSERREAAQEQAAAAATFIVLSDSKTSTVSVTDRILFDGSYWDIFGNIPSRELNAGREIEAVRQAA